MTKHIFVYISILLLGAGRAAAAPTTAGTRAFCEAFELPEAPRVAGCLGRGGKDAHAAGFFADAGRLAHQCLELVNSGLASKHVAMAQAGAKACAAARLSFLKDLRRGPAARAAMASACRAALSGQQKKGAPCESALECAGDLVCAGRDGGPPGSCVAALPVGANCSADPVNGSAIGRLFADLKPVCGAGHHCAGTTCAPDLGAGAACGAGDPLACGPGRRCVKGACAEDRLGLTGDACARAGDCAAGLLCRGGACARAAAAGAACQADDDCAGVCRAGRCETLCGSP